MLGLGIVGSGQKFIIKSNAFAPSQIKTKIRFIGANTYRGIVEFDENDLIDQDTEELYSGSKEDYLPTMEDIAFGYLDGQCQVIARRKQSIG